jgi:LPXTG-motif cell wall-anchored protein
VNIQTIRSLRPGRGRLRRLALASALAAAATTAVAVPFAASPAQAASENKLPPSKLEIKYNEDSGNFGDVPMPDCGSWNIEGRRGFAHWTIESSLGSGSSVFAGEEWDVKLSMYVDNLDASPWLYNDGPDPLITQLAPTGPVERTQIEGILPAGLGVHHPYGGDWFVGPLNSIGTWGFAFDNNSEPTLDGFHQETSDGVDLTFRVRMRATDTGVVKLPKLQVSGWDSTPTAAEVNCSVALNWQWNVIDTDAPLVKGETVKTDARYFWEDVPANDGERNDGGHGISIDVLANDDDLNTPGGVGDTDEIRIYDFSLTSAQNVNINCGAGSWQSEDFEQLFEGPCIYSPPDGFVGVDTFFYTVKQRSDGKTTQGKVTINVVPNQRPQTAVAELYVDENTDDSFDLSDYMGDPKGEPLTCLTDLVSENTPLGSVTMNADCTFDWDSEGPGNSMQTFTYRVCDTHPLLAEHGTNAAKWGDYTNGIAGDLSATTSRLCTNGTVELFVQDVLVFPPVAKLDFATTDAWYGPGFNPNSTFFAPLANDYTPNAGPAPNDASILDGPEPAEGQAIMQGELIQFTAAPGAEGEVTFTYQSCSTETQLCGVGKVVVEILPNAAPEPADDWTVVAQPFQVVDFDLSANDVEPDGEDFSCEDISAPSDPALVASYSLGADCLLDVDPADGVTGVVTFDYEMCDVHLLLNEPLTSSRCTTATVEVTIINPLIIVNPEDLPQVEPGPEGPPDPTDPPVDTTQPPVDTTQPSDTTIVPPTPPSLPTTEIPNPGELPATGGNTGPIALIAALMVLLGGVVVVTARRRSSQA